MTWIEMNDLLNRYLLVACITMITFYILSKVVLNSFIAYLAYKIKYQNEKTITLKHIKIYQDGYDTDWWFYILPYS